MSVVVCGRASPTVCVIHLCLTVVPLPGHTQTGFGEGETEIRRCFLWGKSLRKYLSYVDGKPMNQEYRGTSCIICMHGHGLQRTCVRVYHRKRRILTGTCGFLIYILCLFITNSKLHLTVLSELISTKYTLLCEQNNQ